MAEKPKQVRKKAKDKQKEQSERFIETAQMLGADATGAAFEDAFTKLVPPKTKRSK